VSATIVSNCVLVDSSGWLEYLTDDTKKPLFEPYLVAQDKTLIVPTIVIYEVRKVLLSQQQKTAADRFYSEASRLNVIPLDEQIAADAATNSVQLKMPIADAIIYTTAIKKSAQIITSDAHFKNIPNALVL
jgi:toxin FitB